MNIFSKFDNVVPNLIFLLIIFFHCHFLGAQQLAFPSAKGAGAYVTGGRGQEVYHVTNLNDNGKGSLRDALSKSNRTIVFDVSGVIKLTSELHISNKSNITIAGQTAPEGGITIAGEQFHLTNVQNLIVRYIRFKGGIDSKSFEGGPSSSFQSKDNSLNQIFDHCSFSFGFFQGGSWYEASGDYVVDNLTVQRCFFAENERGVLSGTISGGKSVTGKFSFISNAFYNVSHRTPNIAGDHGRIDVINNIVWYVKNRLMQPNGSMLLNHIGNYYNFNYTEASDYMFHNFGSNTGIPKIYTNGNKYVAQYRVVPISNSISQINSNNKLAFKFFVGEHYGKQVPDLYFTNNQHSLNGEPFKILTGDEALIDVSNNVGCNARINEDGSISDNLDVLDAQWLDNIKNGIYTRNRLAPSQWKVPDINSIKRPSGFYGKNPHIPEVWFKANVPDGQDHNDIAPSGYTWLEEYLNQVDRPKNVVAVQSVEITPEKNELEMTKTVQLSAVFSPTNATNKNGKWFSSNENIASVDINGSVTGVAVGDVIITFTSADGGIKATSQIKVFPEALHASAGIDQQICAGSSTTLTATGGSTYLWSTGATTSSITVSPDKTTTYTVTAFDSAGENSDSDEVTVTVNPLPEVNAGPDVTITIGEKTTLTATGAESYKWSTGETTQSIVVGPTSTTTYTVIGTTNGCKAIDSVTVFSVEASVKANAGGDVEICSGSSVTLTASGGSTYLWNTGATTASITVSPNATETYSVTAYGNTEGNSDTDEVMVTVKPLPIVNAGSDITIEQGESATLTASGATSYKWDTGADGASITVSPSSTKTYTVTGTSNGCQATDRVRVVVLGTVEVIADAGKDQQICIGSSATLTATGGATYLWSTGETTASITVNPNSTTSYSVTAYDATGNFSDTDDVIVTVNPLPVVSAGKNVTIYSGESTVLSATGANSYKWSTGDTGASVTVSPTTTQTYTVTGRSNGCEDTSTVSVVVLPAVEVIADAGKNQQICEGSSVTLNATGGATYLWSTGETTASITVSPNSTTKYTVTVYDDTGKFSDTDDVMVTVNPLPVINAGKNVTINSGESTILTATGATSYKWNTGAVGNKITVRPTVTTTYTVTGVSNGCEAVSTVTVTVKTPQKVVASAGKDQDICEGGSVKLTATGGETYLWSTGAKTPSITVSPKSTAKYSVTAYVGDVSAKAEVVVNVTANPKVKIANGSETSLLKGERVTLSASGAKTYKWNNGAVQPNITVIPNSTQTYKVTGFNDKCAAERSVKVNVLEKVVASAGKDVTIYRNEKTVLTATGPKGSEYLWSTGETTKSITVSPEESTVYSVMVYHALDSDTANVTVNVIDLVDEDILDDSTNLKFLIHPNPTNGELHVKVSGLTYLSSIHLYDLSGKSLYSEIINESDHHTYVKTLDLSNYATGIYLLQLINNNSVITKKVVLR